MAHGPAAELAAVAAAAAPEVPALPAAADGPAAAEAVVRTQAPPLAEVAEASASHAASLRLWRRMGEQQGEQLCQHVPLLRQVTQALLEVRLQERRQQHGCSLQTRAETQVQPAGAPGRWKSTPCSNIAERVSRAMRQEGKRRGREGAACLLSFSALPSAKLFLSDGKQPYQATQAKNGQHMTHCNSAGPCRQVDPNLLVSRGLF